MSHTITPTDAGDVTAVMVPSDGDARSAASVEVGFQGCANLGAYCRSFLLGTRPGASLQNPTLTGTVTVNGTSLFNGLAGFNGGASFAGPGKLGIDFDSGIENQGKFRNINNGYIAKRIIKNTGTATIEPKTCDVINIIGTNVGRIVTILNGPAATPVSDTPTDGMTLWVSSSIPTPATVRINGADLTFGTATSGHYRWIYYYWDGALWVAAASQVTP